MSIPCVHNQWGTSLSTDGGLRMKRRVRLLAGVAALAAAMATAPLGAGSAAAVRLPQGTTQGAATATDGQWVTLVSGHRVFATRDAQGRWSVLTEPEADGRPAAF